MQKNIKEIEIQIFNRRDNLLAYCYECNKEKSGKNK